MLKTHFCEHCHRYTDQDHAWYVDMPGLAWVDCYVCQVCHTRTVERERMKTRT